MKVNLIKEHIFKIELKKCNFYDFYHDFYFKIKFYDNEIYDYDKILKIKLNSEELQDMINIIKPYENIEECIKMIDNRRKWDKYKQYHFPLNYLKKAKNPLYSSFYPKAISLNNLFKEEL